MASSSTGSSSLDYNIRYFDGSSANAAWAGTPNAAASILGAGALEGSYFVPYFDGNTQEAAWQGAPDASESRLTLFETRHVDKHYGGVKDWSVRVEGASRYIGQGSAGIPSATFSLASSPDSFMLGQEDMSLVSKDYGTFAGSVTEGGVGIVTSNVTVEGVLGRLNTEVAATDLPYTYNDGAENIYPAWNEWNFADYGITDFAPTIGRRLYETVAIHGMRSNGSQSVLLFSQNGALLHEFVFAAGHPVIRGINQQFSNGMMILWQDGANWVLQEYIWNITPSGIQFLNENSDGTRDRITVPAPQNLSTQGNVLGRGNPARGAFPYVVFGTSIGYELTNFVNSSPGSVDWTASTSACTPNYSSWGASCFFSGMVRPNFGQVPEELTIMVGWRMGPGAQGVELIRSGAVTGSLSATAISPGASPESFFNHIDLRDRSATNNFVVSWGSERAATFSFLDNVGYPVPFRVPGIADRLSEGNAFNRLGMLSVGLILAPGGIIRSGYEYSSLHDNVEYIASRVKPFTGALVTGQYVGNAIGATPSWVDTPWNKLNEFAAVHQLQVTQGNGYMCVFSWSDWSDPTNLGNMSFQGADITANQAYRFIEIEYTNSRITQSLPAASTASDIGSTYSMYNALDEGDTFSVDAGQVITEEIDTLNYPIKLMQPIRTSVIAQANWTNRYYVIGSDNLPVVANQWEDFGGKVEVKINTTQPGVIDLIITGPGTAIPGVPGPYTIGISDGSTTRGAINIAGIGVKTAPETLQLSTGADWSKVTEESSGSALQNIYVRTLTDAWDYGFWAAPNYSGTEIRFRALIPYSDCGGFALTVGSKHEYKDSVWQAVSCEFSRVGVELGLAQVSTVDDYEQSLLGTFGKVGQFEKFWDQYKVKDFSIAPLRSPNPEELV